jgi:hypothetical protein
VVCVCVVCVYVCVFVCVCVCVVCVCVCLCVCSCQFALRAPAANTVGLMAVSAALLSTGVANMRERVPSAGV